jgi:hypothetical protein
MVQSVASAADVQHEAVEQRLTLNSVRDFRVKLHSVNFGLAMYRHQQLLHQLEAGVPSTVAAVHPYIEHAFFAFGVVKSADNL